MAIVPQKYVAPGLYALLYHLWWMGDCDNVVVFLADVVNNFIYQQSRVEIFKPVVICGRFL